MIFHFWLTTPLPKSDKNQRLHEPLIILVICVMSSPRTVEPTLSAVIVESFDGTKSGGRFHGTGVARFYNGQTYTGAFDMGTMHGHGHYSWGDETVFEGNFDRNRLSGTGSYQWVGSSGSRYVP